MQSHFYHFTRVDSLVTILQDEEPSLRPRCRFIAMGRPEDYAVPKKASDFAVFGLMNPYDRNWATMEHTSDEGLIETLVSKPSRCPEFAVLKISVKPEDDIYVADFSPHMDPEYKGLHSQHEPVTKRVKKAYWDSLVPFFEYQVRDLNYALPEVVSFTPFPLSRLSIDHSIGSLALTNKFRAIAGRKPKESPAAFESSPEKWAMDVASCTHLPDLERLGYQAPRTIERHLHHHADVRPTTQGL